MSDDAREVRLPDLGDFADVEVIEVLVNPGDRVAPEDTLIVIESDKASMDIPSPAAGTVASVAVAVGDKINSGDLIVTLSAAEAHAAPASADTEPAPAPGEAAPEEDEAPFRRLSQQSLTELQIPSRHPIFRLP